MPKFSASDHLHESVRAVAAYHSVLVFMCSALSILASPYVSRSPEERKQPLFDLRETYRGYRHKNLLSATTMRKQALYSALTLF